MTVQLNERTQLCLIATLSLQTLLPGSSMISAARPSARAGVATHTRRAPAWRSSRAHSEAVAPVVSTSSTSRISRPFTRSRARNLERSADLLTPLFRIQRYLRFRKAHPQQSSHIQRHPPSNRLFDPALCGACDQFRLVESARAHPQFVHRHRDHQQLRAHRCRLLVAGRLQP